MSVELEEDFASRLRLTYSSDIKDCSGGRLLKFKTRNVFESHLARVKHDFAQRGKSDEFEALQLQARRHVADQSTLPPLKKEATEIEQAEQWFEKFWLAKRKQQLTEEKFKERVSAAVQSYDSKLTERPQARKQGAARRAELLRQRGRTLNNRTWIADDNGKPDKELDLLLNHLESKSIGKGQPASSHVHEQLDECKNIARSMQNKGVQLSPKLLHAALVTPERASTKDKATGISMIKLAYPGQLLPCRTVQRKSSSRGKSSKKYKRKGKKGKGKKPSKVKKKSSKKVKR